jgi:hypothetical protein
LEQTWFVQRIFASLSAATIPPTVTMIDSTAVKPHRSSAGARESPEKRGIKSRAIGRSRGGRTTKIHAIVDDEGRPHALLLTGGNVADITGASQLLAATDLMPIIYAPFSRHAARWW